MTNKKTIIGFAILSSAVILAGLLPFLVIFNHAGDSWQGILPAGYVFDSEFYMVRMVKGTGLFPFGNNPFSMERSAEFNPALSVGDYIAAIPLKLGLPLTHTMVFNTIFWNLIFTGVLWFYLRNLGIAGNWTFYMLSFVYISVYGMLIRPVVLQIVLPFFTFFLFSLSNWLKNKSRKNEIILAAGAAGALYIYPYTWQISFLMLGLCFLLYLKERRWLEAVSQVRAVALGLVLASPAIYYLYKIAFNPAFPEFLKNIGSIQTHLPSFISFQLIRWVITNILLWNLISRYIPELKNDNAFGRAKLMSALHGLAIFILAMSPLFTGRDGAIGDHLGRETFFWLSISMTAVAYYLFVKGHFYRLNIARKIIILLLVLVNVVPVLRQYKRSLLQPLQADKAEVLDVQPYAVPIAWLENYDKNPARVWASPGIGGYIPIYSKFYILSLPDLAFQFWNSKSDIQEQFLASVYFNEATPQFLVDEGSTVAVGLSYFRRFDDLRWKEEVCDRFRLIMLNGCIPKSLGQTTDEVLALRNKDIAGLIVRNHNEIRPRITELLKKYKVAYAVKDTLNDPDFHVEKFKNTKEIYNDGRFVIYKFN